MPHSIYQLKVSLLETESRVWRRIQVSANVTLRQAHGVLQKALAREGERPYRFCQDGREFGRSHAGVYLEDYSMYSLRHCLCALGEMLEYHDGPWRYSIVLETIERATGPFPWRVLDGAGICSGPEPAPSAAPLVRGMSWVH